MDLTSVFIFPDNEDIFLEISKVEQFANLMPVNDFSCEIQPGCKC